MPQALIAMHICEETVLACTAWNYHVMDYSDLLGSDHDVISRYITQMPYNASELYIYIISSHALLLCRT